MTENKIETPEETPTDKPEIAHDPKPLNFKELSDLQLKEMARDFYKGKIFSHLHVPQDEADQALRQIFMPLALGGLRGVPEEEIRRIGLIFEYLEKSGPTIFNGYPTFMSYQMLDQEQTDKLFAIVHKYEAFEEQMMKE